MNYVSAILANAANEQRRTGVEYKVAKPQIRPDIEGADDDLIKVVKLAEKLAPKSIELTKGAWRNDQVKVARFVQKVGEHGEKEFIELEAIKPVDLSNGWLGDSTRHPTSGDKLRLPPDLKLKAGDRIRIFPTYNYENVRIVELRYRKGIWKGVPGKGDRVWLATSDGNIILDFEYKVR